ncbi:MAG TPA: 2OG-Fe(II) oxygenase [Candidatus Dormibacteraeota bacterium]|nr:2OG-Fe(II) oxygenase [Candidatus Dormibacteraeota bacterium]
MGEIEQSLWEWGFAQTGVLLSREECDLLRGLYSDASRFRSRIDMARYRFGLGEYQYFAYPLPELVAELREVLYGRLAGPANAWMGALGLAGKFPAEHDAFLKQCAKHGQTRPTPLLLRYRKGDYNCLHQDVYGEVVFPFQVIFCLSRPGEEFDGGELLLVEQRPRAQSLGHAITLQQGEGVVITTRYRPVRGSRGHYRANLRHGVSKVVSGERYMLGIIFHDGK